MLNDTEEYKMKVNKLMIEFDNGRLPDTNFFDTFMPRVKDKIKNNKPLTDREKEVLDDLFTKY